MNDTSTSAPALTAEAIISGFASTNPTFSQTFVVEFLEVVEQWVDRQSETPSHMSGSSAYGKILWPEISLRLLVMGRNMSATECCKMWKYLAYHRLPDELNVEQYDSDKVSV